MEFAAEDTTGEVLLPATMRESHTRAIVCPTGSPTAPRGRLSLLDPPDFDTLYRDLSPYLWRALRRLGVADRDVDDVVQDVFIIVHRKLSAFDGRSSLRSFVYGIALRVASDYRKKAYRRRERVSDHPPEREVPPNQVHHAEQQRARALLDTLLLTLDEKKLAVFVLYEIEQLPMDEVADAVGCTPATAYARLSAARKGLKRSLARKQALGQVGENFHERGTTRSHQSGGSRLPEGDSDGGRRSS